MFIDKAKIYVKAGNGGPGCVSFRREKYVPLGGPDGGNGGKGGDVYIQADKNLRTLLDLAYKPHVRAKNGMTGGTSNKFGRSAEDVTVKVPTGTIVFKDGKLMADMKENGAILMVAKGGRGGRGNSSFKTHRNTAPKIAEKGEPGESIVLNLELRLIAEVGLVGFPNAGKSTFLSRISAARPKIADYPFTTLEPNLGVVYLKNNSFVVADIPGLIDGAHEGRGLGDEFLRHVQRTKVLIHIVDLFGFGEKTAVEAYKAINRELKLYSPKLASKPMVIAANKMDLTGSKEKLAEFKSKNKKKIIFPVSAVTGEGIGALMNAVLKAVLTIPEEPVEAEPVKQYIYKPEFTIEKAGDLFVVRGEKIEKIAAMTNFDLEESLERFQNIVRKMGIEKALEKKGVKIGDAVRVADFEFIYEK